MRTPTTAILSTDRRKPPRVTAQTQPTSAALTTCPRCASSAPQSPPSPAPHSHHHWQLACPSCERPLLSESTLAEIQSLSDGDRCSLASALGEPMLAQLSELAHDLRMSTMGEMVAGLAHELNQPLYAISNYARTCQNLLNQQADVPEELMAITERLVNQSSRAADIVRRLRRFVSRREPRRTRLDINQLIGEVEQLMLFHANRFRIRVEVQLAEQLPVVLGDSLLIEQVLVNLVRNSFESLADSKTEGPVVTVESACHTPDTIEILVTDNGPGFGGVPLEQLFEPYFTTKASGMGLGLVISRSIVQAHGGSLTASHTPQGGAMMRVALPVTSEDL